MNDSLVCWRCGASIADWPLPLSRTAECKQCHADLHVCKLCEYFDPRLGKQCREPVAEEVHNKERANFCGYFSAEANAFRPADHDAQHRARAQLDALFGGTPSAPTVAPGTQKPATDTELARAKLEDLFTGPKKD